MAAAGRKRGRSQRSTGMLTLGRINAFALWNAGILGTAASIQLLLTERAHIANPTATLECDINPLIGCGASLMSEQAHIFGIPNSVLGIVAFAGLTLLATLALLMPLWRGIWLLAGVAAAGGVAFVAWFLYHSVVTFHTLCPYCVLVWIATLTSAGILLPQALVAARKRNVSSTVMSHTWAYVMMLYLVVALIVIIGMREQIGSLL